MCTQPLFGLTVKDLVTIEGEQDNEISGQGLVVGLDGTGDKDNALKDIMLQNWLHNSDLDVPAERFATKNVALVNVSGRMPPYAGKGQKIPLRVSTVGDAKSQRGFCFIHKCIIQGQWVVVKLSLLRLMGLLSWVRISWRRLALFKGIVHTPIPSTVVKEGVVRLQLKKPDWVDADRISRQINQHFQRTTNRMDQAKALNPGLIEVEVPQQYKNREVSFIANMKKIPVLFTDVAAKILINSRTNMVMLNEKVEVSPFAFAYKDLNVVVGGGPKKCSKYR